MTSRPREILEREIAEAIEGGGTKARGKTARPFKIATTKPATMTAGAINKELDRLDEQNSALGRQMIDQGRGYERPSEYLRMTDPLSMELRRNSDRRMALRIEIGARYGPGAPTRLPSGRFWGPREKARED